MKNVGHAIALGAALVVLCGAARATDRDVDSRVKAALACYTGCGTIFKLAPPSGGSAWTETVLYSWPNNPQSSIVVFSNGLLYGTTFFLGAANVGSVFELAP